MHQLTALTALALILAQPVLAQEAAQQDAPAEAPADAEQQQPEPAPVDEPQQQSDAEAAPADPGAAPDAAPDAPAPEVAPDAIGQSGGGIGETFFIRTPQEYHMLASDLPGEPVYFDTSTRVDQMSPAEGPEAAGTVEEAFREGERPVGTIVDVLVDRAGQVAALVIELDAEMRGGAREVAVATGLVRMLSGRDDPAQTVVLLALDPVDLENAPNFERTGGPAAE